MTGTSRAAYLEELSGLLWPAPARVTRGRAGEPGRGYLLVPSAADPRLVLPDRAPRAAAAAVFGFNKDRSPGSRVRTELLARALRWRAGALLLRDGLRVEAEPGTATIETELSAAVGQEVVVALHVGPARANRKPVLQVLTPSGRTLAFAKLGTSELTARLVRDEAAALGRLHEAGLRTVRVPRVLRLGTWQGAPLLVQEALPVWERRPRLDQDRLAAAMSEVAYAAGGRTEELSEGPGAAIAARVADLPDRPERAVLQAAVERIQDRAAGVKAVTGAWHGDWTRWNMAAATGPLLVWDWERFADGVPVGFDALHHRLQEEIVGKGRAPRDGAAALLAAADGLLARMDVPAAARHAVTGLYMVELATRYLRDRQAEAAAALGHVDRWLLPAIGHHLGQTSTHRRTH